MRVAPALAERISSIDGKAVEESLDEQGYGLIPGLLSGDECADLLSRWSDEGAFRSRIDMARHGYGRGAYSYFAYPLPPPIEQLRTGLYPPLAGIADRWKQAFGEEASFPPDHAEFLEQCHAAGQTRPTPLLLRYRTGGFNRLHQDVYGEQLFPLQAIVMLSEPEADFTGGELVITEQRARMQSRVEIVPLRRGDAAVIAVRERPGRGKRGAVRLAMRHGVSRIRSGERFTLGIIFHDAA
ncbi:MAG: 2OG-Fe(II) oxygenase [Parasphingopyxis sp.]|nr:2OG-Fe(II) oxygenase [Sphingomonadales bacterium]